MVFLLIIPWLLFGQYQHIYILHTNDIHGSLLPTEAFWMSEDFPPPIGNAAAAVTVINELRKEAGSKGIPVILLDGGDIFAGTPIGDFSKGQAVIDYFNYLDYDAISLGNHDFNLGLEVLKSLIEKSDSPWLCANLIDSASGELVNFTKPHIILEKKGVKIGIFGLVTHHLKGMLPKEKFAGYDVISHYEGARKAIEELRKNGADIIIGLTHIGYSHDKRLADSIPGIDVIIGAHSHTGIEPPFETPRYHTIITQAYSKLTAVGFLDLKIDLRTKRIAGYEGRLIDLLAEEWELDNHLLKRLKDWQAIAEKGFDSVLGYSKRELTRAGMEESPAGNLITDAMREAFNADIAVHNSGGIRANFPQGEITYRDIYKIDAFGNTAVTMILSGRQVKEMLEVSVNGRHAIFQVSGLKMIYDKTKPIGERVLSVKVGDELLDENKEYKVVTNSFLATGSGDYGIFKEGRNIEDSHLPLRDIIAEYVKRHSPIDARVEGRIQKIKK